MGKSEIIRPYFTVGENFRNQNILSLFVVSSEVMYNNNTEESNNQFKFTSSVDYTTAK